MPIGELYRAIETGHPCDTQELRVVLRQIGFKIKRLADGDLLMLPHAIMVLLAVMVNLASVEARFTPAPALIAALTAMICAEVTVLGSVGFPTRLSLYSLADKDTV